MLKCLITRLHNLVLLNHWILHRMDPASKSMTTHAISLISPHLTQGYSKKKKVLSSNYTNNPQNFTLTFGTTVGVI